MMAWLAQRPRPLRLLYVGTFLWRLGPSFSNSGFGTFNQAVQACARPMFAVTCGYLLATISQSCCCKHTSI